MKAEAWTKLTLKIYDWMASREEEQTKNVLLLALRKLLRLDEMPLDKCSSFQIKFQTKINKSHVKSNKKFRNGAFEKSFNK